MDNERRLSDDDVTLVLRRAGEMTAEQGMTVAQVQEIARDVGLSPEAVQRALAEAVSGALRPASVERTLGVPVAVSKDVALNGVLTEDDWDVLVSAMRATFNAHGKERSTGKVREWRNGNLRIALEPAATGHRLRMSTRKVNALFGPAIGSVTAAAYTAFVLAAAARKPAFLLLAIVPALLGVVSVVWPFITLPKWARLRSTQFDALAREAAALAAERDAAKALESGEPRA